MKTHKVKTFISILIGMAMGFVIQIIDSPYFSLLAYSSVVIGLIFSIYAINIGKIYKNPLIKFPAIYVRNILISSITPLLFGNLYTSYINNNKKEYANKIVEHLEEFKNSNGQYPTVIQPDYLDSNNVAIYYEPREENNEYLIYYQIDDRYENYYYSESQRWITYDLYD